MNNRLIWVVILIFTAALTSSAQGGGNAIQFASASSQYVNVPFTPGLRPANAVTLEAWINTDWQTIGQVAMVGNTEVGGYEFDVNFISGGNSIMFEVHRNGSYGNPYIAGRVLSAGWHHFAGTYDGRYAKLYVDGNLASTNDAGAVYPIHYSSYNNDLIIGAEAYQANTPYGAYFNGQLDEIRIWNYARSQTEIQNAMHQSLAGNESGLLAYYMMDESAGSTSIIDHTGNGYTGFVHGAAFVASTVSLPVELSSFSAHSSASSVELRWTTATEVNNHGFEVERRNVSSPGGQAGFKSQGSPVQSSNLNPETPNSVWTNIAFVEGNGTSNIQHAYSYADRSISAGTYAFRLKQIDRDGTFSYSQEVEAVIASAPHAIELHQNYPNPFNPTTMIRYQLPNAAHITLRIYDMLGKEIAALVNEEQSAGMQSVEWNGGALPSGLYIARLSNGTQVNVIKMQLLK